MSCLLSSPITSALDLACTLRHFGLVRTDPVLVDKAGISRLVFQPPLAIDAEEHLRPSCQMYPHLTQSLGMDCKRETIRPATNQCNVKIYLLHFMLHVVKSIKPVFETTFLAGYRLHCLDYLQRCETGQHFHIFKQCLTPRILMFY